MLNYSLNKTNGNLLVGIGFQIQVRNLSYNYEKYYF